MLAHTCVRTQSSSTVSYVAASCRHSATLVRCSLRSRQRPIFHWSSLLRPRGREFAAPGRWTMARSANGQAENATCLTTKGLPDATPKDVRLLLAIRLLQDAFFRSLLASTVGL